MSLHQLMLSASINQIQPTPHIKLFAQSVPVLPLQPSFLSDPSLLLVVLSLTCHPMPVFSLAHPMPVFSGLLI